MLMRYLIPIAQKADMYYFRLNLNEVLYKVQQSTKVLQQLSEKHRKYVIIKEI